MSEAAAARVAIVVKGYPRLSETFIAQEILALEKAGFNLDIWSLRQPTDRYVHPMHKQIAASRHYLPEYLHEAPWRVLMGMWHAVRLDGFSRTMRTWWRDFRRDRTRNRLRRIGQAMVLARELDPAIRHLHVHYLHTPASVVRYAAMLTGRSWSASAHAKDIWTTPDWEKREKLADADWCVTCTAQGHAHLVALAPQAGHVRLVYHGLDLSRFPAPPATRPIRDGTDASNPVRIVSVGRAVAKKGFADLLEALACLPTNIAWQFVHVGGGELLESLKATSERLGLAGKVAFMGPLAQPDIIELMREADIFALPARPTASGDQDGLPNVLMEAASQELAIVASDFAGIPEFIRDGIEGLLVPPGAVDALANALNLLARDPQRRRSLGAAACRRLRSDFGMETGIAEITESLHASLGRDRHAPGMPLAAE